MEYFISTTLVVYRIKDNQVYVLFLEETAPIWRLSSLNPEYIREISNKNPGVLKCL